MKKSADSKKADELLKKLQASFLGSAQNKRTNEEDEQTEEDRAFQEKLANMLQQATASTEPKSKDKKKKKASGVSKAPTSDLPTEESLEPEKPLEPEAEGSPAAPTLDEPSNEDRSKTIEDTEGDEESPSAPTAPPANAVSSVKEKKSASRKTSRPTEKISPVHTPSETSSEGAVNTDSAIAKERQERVLPMESVESTVSAIDDEQPAPTILPKETPVEEEPIATDSSPLTEPVRDLEKEEAQQNAKAVPPADEASAFVPTTADNEVPSLPKKKLPARMPSPEGDARTYTQEFASSRAETPRRITPNTPPSSNHSEEKNTIVIKPKTIQQKPAEPIVIAPRNHEPAVLSSPSPEPSTPIRINGEEPSVTLPRESNAADFAKKNPKPQSASSMPQSDESTPPTNEHADSEAPAPRRVHSAAKRRIHTIQKTPVTPLPEEGYDEVLDELIPEEETVMEEVPYEEPEVVPSPQTEPKRFRHSLRRQRPTAHAPEHSLPIYDLIKSRTGLDEDDISMIFDLGYDNELGRLVGYENLKKLKAEHLRRNSNKDQKHYRTSFGYRGEEYTGSNREAIIAAYVKDRHSLIIRILLTALLTVLLFFLEFPEWTGTALAPLAQQMPALFGGLSILALLLTGIVSRRILNAGIRSFFKFEASPYSPLSLLFPLVLCYDLVLLIFPNPSMLRLNLLVALATLLVSVIDVYRLVGELRSFKIISSNEEKTVLAPAPSRKKKLRYGDKIVRIINDDAGEALYRVQTTKDTTGFFRRFNAMDAAISPFTILITMAGGLAFVAALSYAVFIAPDFFQALSVAMTVLVVSAPLGAVFSFFYPLCRANGLLGKKNCTLVGEESVEELAGPKTVIFDDYDMYTAQKCNEISVRQSDDFKEDLLIAGVLFRKLGSTLSVIGKTSPKPVREDLPITIVRITDHGVEAIVNNKHHVLAGSAEFLAKNSIRVPKESTDKALRRLGNVSVMYVAINSALKLSYELEYRTYRSFEAMIALLSEHNTAVAIHSYDPNLNDPFLQNSRVDTAEQVRVIKPLRYEQSPVLEVTDTGAVTIGKKTELAYPIYAANTVRQTRRRGMALQMIFSAIGAVGTSVLLFMGHADQLSFVPIVGYHLVTLFASMLHVWLSINERTLHLRSTKKKD